MFAITLLLSLIIGVVAFISWKKAGLSAAVAGSTFVSSCLLGLLTWFVASRQTYFDEVWNYKVAAVRYYEPWDEEVSCRHPRYKTVSRTDSKGRSYTTTEQDGYEHSYDVDYHTKHWEALTEYNRERSISQSEYERWKQLWGNNVFIDMHRSYHSIDGDMYESRWKGEFDLMYPMEEINSYQNKVRVSKSVFNYPEVSKEVREKYWRPADKGITGAVISYDGQPLTDNEDLRIRRVNALLGRQYKVHVIVVLWNANTSRSEMEQVMAAWRGPNKNELVLAIGLGEGRKIAWADCWSWCDDTTVHSMVRQHVTAMPTLNFVELSKVLTDDVPKYWKKKSFKDFDYINVPVPWWAYAVHFALTSGAAGGAIAFFGTKQDLFGRQGYQGPRFKPRNHYRHG